MRILIYLFLILLGCLLVVECESGCPRGFCLDGRCPRLYAEQCLENDCWYGFRRCGNNTLTCVTESHPCPGESCEKYEYSCINGECFNMNFGDVKCKDGSEPCARHQKRCNNSACVDRNIRCLEDPCPESLPYKCGELCLNMSVVCDFKDDCLHGEDEEGCIKGYSHQKNSAIENTLFIVFRVIPAVASFVAISLIIYLCCKYCCKKNPEEESGHNVNPDAEIPLTNVCHGGHLSYKWS